MACAAPFTCPEQGIAQSAPCGLCRKAFANAQLVSMLDALGGYFFMCDLALGRSERNFEPDDMNPDMTHCTLTWGPVQSVWFHPMFVENQMHKV